MKFHNLYLCRPSLFFGKLILSLRIGSSLEIGQVIMTLAFFSFIHELFRLYKLRIVLIGCPFIFPLWTGCFICHLQWSLESGHLTLISICSSCLYSIRVKWHHLALLFWAQLISTASDCSSATASLVISSSSYKTANLQWTPCLPLLYPRICFWRLHLWYYVKSN